MAVISDGIQQKMDLLLITSIPYETMSTLKNQWEADIGRFQCDTLKSLVDQKLYVPLLLPKNVVKLAKGNFYPMSNNYSLGLQGPEWFAFVEGSYIEFQR